MKFVFVILCCLSLFRVQAQELTFCEGVDLNGTPTNPSSFFQISKKGGFLTLLVKLPRKTEAQDVVFDIYKTDTKSGKELLDNTIHLTTPGGWSWFSKQITFYKEGDYVVYVFDDRDQLLTAGKVKIRFR